MNLKNITLWKINPFVKITPKKFRLKYDIVPDPKKFRLKYQGARDVILRKSHSRPTHVPPTRSTQGHPAILTNMAPLGASSDALSLSENTKQIGVIRT